MTILTELQVKSEKAADKARRIGDGDGLYLHIAPIRGSGKGGGKSWVFIWKRAGKRHEIGLGTYPDVSLKEARKRAAENQLRLRGGETPISHGAQRTRMPLAGSVDSTPTGDSFMEFTELFIAQHETGWRNPKHRQQWRNTLATYAYPAFGAKSVAAIDVDDVKKVLAPIWREKAETAKRVRGRIERILTAARAEGKRTGDNPAAQDLMKAILGPQKRAVKHHAALPFNELPKFFGRLKGQPGMGAVALQFLILTAARSNEVRNMRWSELDLSTGVWTIPADKMKADREHRVPLCDPAMEILRVRKLARRGDDTDALVFPGEGKRGPKRSEGGEPKAASPSGREVVMSDMTLTAVLKRMGLKTITAHGFRSTFRDWTGDETEFERETAEMALAHTVGDKTEAAYRRETAFRKRTELMKLWGEFCLSSIAKTAKLEAWR
jgi:integrase